MRNGLIGLIGALVGAMVLPATMAGGCADYSGGSGAGVKSNADAGTSGGASAGGSSSHATGGSGTATGGGTSCAPLPASCGGDVVGTWNVTASCLTLSGQLDVSALSVGCSTAAITSGSLSVTGTWTANSDGSCTDATTTSGVVQFTMDATCLTISGYTTDCTGLAQGGLSSLFASVTCTPAATGGGCNCQGTAGQKGTEGYGMGALTAPTGLYTTPSNVLTTTDGRKSMGYDYCVSGSTLTVTPQTTLPITVGTITLTK